MKKIILIALSILVLGSVSAQANLWSSSEKSGNELQTNSNSYLDFDIHQFKSKFLSANSFSLMLPVDGDEYEAFELKVNTLMPKALQDKFPMIRAYDGISLERTKRTAKVEIGPDYFRVMILTPGRETIYIDPSEFTAQEQTHYVLYTKSQLLKENNFECHFSGNAVDIDWNFQPKAIQTCELRTYRLAVAATGEYTIFQGGTVAQALAAQVTTINRVNAIYERDLAITLTFISNNEDIIYLDPTTDPYTNGATGQMIQENMDNVNTVIGTSNFDIGHVFGTDSGGLAYLGSVCNSYKAGGVTGSSAPRGDAFDIDYVCHEMGHQFGANHSFNSACSGNRNNGTAMEPGSGSTIMGYAGVCSPSVQGHSDALFHAISLQEIGIEISSNQHTCPVKTPLNNSAPEILTASNIVVPASTPFVLKAVGADVDGDVLTYTWDQMEKDLTTQPPVATATKGPSFKSFNPTETGKRYIPAIENQLVNNYKWEVLSDGTRTYKFRLTVRDNAAGGGCTEYKDITVSANANAGPFVITYPTTTGISWQGGSTKTVTWDVANTDAAPINCQKVNISISIDKGVTFQTLLENAPNTGSANVQVPNVDANFCQVLIESADETFFTVSRKFFKIKKSSLAVNDLSTQKVDISLFPNPTNGTFRVNFEGVQQLDGYVIFNSLGQVVQSNKKALMNNTELNIRELNSGVYFFQTFVNGEKVLRKIIKN